MWNVGPRAAAAQFRRGHGREVRDDMMLREMRLLIYASLLFVLVLLTRGAWAADMETVKIAPDKKGFILVPSGDRYVPWGHNYASVDIMERLAKDPPASSGSSPR